MEPPAQQKTLRVVEESCCGGDHHSHDHEHSHEHPHDHHHNHHHRDSDEEEDNTKKSPDERIITPADVMTLDPKEESIIHIGTQGTKVTVVSGLEHMVNLKEIVLRSCLISNIDGLEGLSAPLEKIELYDNTITRLCNLSACAQTLRVLDLSFNGIRSLVPLRGLTQLRELYVAQNKLRKIEALEGMSHLRVLDLGANRIRTLLDGSAAEDDGEEEETKGAASSSSSSSASKAGEQEHQQQQQQSLLRDLVSLEQLWLGKNKLTTSLGVSTLTTLRKLDMQSNRLRRLEGLTPLTRLEELYMANNAISTLVDLNTNDAPATSSLPAAEGLSTIDLSGNALTSLQGVEVAASCEELWVSSNQLSDMGEVQTALKTLPQLQCIYLEHNPLAPKGTVGTQARIIAAAAGSSSSSVIGGKPIIGGGMRGMTIGSGSGNGSDKREDVKLYQEALMQVAPGLTQIDALVLPRQARR